MSETESGISAGAIAALTGASALGVSLVDDPVGFVIAVIVEWFVGGILSLLEAIVMLISTVWIELTDAIIILGSALAESGGIVGETIALVLNELILVVESVASIGGPAAPFIIVLVWAGVVVAIALLIRAGLEVVKWI